MDSKESSLLKPILQTGKSFFALVAVLAGVIGVFGYAWWTQLNQGLAVTGMRDIPGASWGIYIASFIFFIGLAHGGIAVSAAVRLMKLETYRPVARMGEVLTIISLILAGMMVTFDLGRPDRILNLFEWGRWQSPFFWDMLVISIYFVSSVVYLHVDLQEDLANLTRNIKLPKWKRLYKLLGAGFAEDVKVARIIHERMLKRLSFMILLMIVLASGGVIPWIFGLQVGRPGWFSALAAPEFVTAAIASAIAAVILVASIMRGVFKWESYIKPEIFKGLGNFMAIALAVYFYMLIAEQITVNYAGAVPELRVSSALLWGEYAILFWSFLTLGLLIPIAILTIPKLKTVMGATVASILVLGGFWIKRVIIVVPSLQHPYLPYPPVAYIPTWVEWSLLGGAVALGILIYALFLKIFPIVDLRVLETSKEDQKVVS